VPDLIVDYDPEWPKRYELEAGRLRRALGSLTVAIEHVGSTAVPGLAAKPTVDIALGVRELDDVRDSHLASMEALGYVYRGEAGVAGRHYFRKGARYPRDFHVSVVERDGPLWRDYLLLRDYLRSHPQAAADYVRTKRGAERAARAGGPVSYGHYKREFVEELLERASAETSAL
jgi:GrpB-like predicted nucleotidyltransferase (UPF0157 family)